MRLAVPEVREFRGHDGHDVDWTREHCSRTRQRFPRSNPPSEYRRAGEDAPRYPRRVPASGPLDPDIRLSRLHCGPGSVGEPGGTALLRPVPAARADALGSTWLGDDQARGGGATEP